MQKLDLREKYIKNRQEKLNLIIILESAGPGSTYVFDSIFSKFSNVFKEKYT